MLALMAVLCIRAMGQTIIVIRYTLQALNKPAYLDVVAEAVYGLPTVLIYIILNSLNHPTPSTVMRSDILRKGRRNAKKDLIRQRADASRGGPPALTLRLLLLEIEENPTMYLPYRIQAGAAPVSDFEFQNVLGLHIKDVVKLHESICSST